MRDFKKTWENFLNNCLLMQQGRVIIHIYIHTHLFDQLSWLERCADNAKVTGQIPLYDNAFALFSLSILYLYNITIENLFISQVILPTGFVSFEPECNMFIYQATRQSLAWSQKGF